MINNFRLQAGFGMPNPLPALSVLWPVIGFLMPAFAIHAGFYGRRAGGLIAIILHCFE